VWRSGGEISELYRQYFLKISRTKVFEPFEEGPEGVKWELGFRQIFTGNVGFGSLGLGFGHWEWESQTEKQ